MQQSNMKFYIFILNSFKNIISLVVFASLFIKTINSEELLVYSNKADHMLMGWNTPMYLSKLKLIEGKLDNVYERMEYPTVSGQNLKPYEDCILLIDSDEMLDEVSNVEENNYNVKKNFMNGDRMTRNLYYHESPTLDVVYPQILVVVDYETYKAYDENLVSLAIYMAAFWNAVDLRFMEIQNPKIQLNIAGLVVATDPSVEPYLKRDSRDGKYFRDLGMTLSDVDEFFYKKFPEHHDIVVVMTRRGLTITKSREIIGNAFRATACQYGLSTALVRDLGGFEGVINAAHELGHLFGAIHDGEYTRNISAKSCPSHDGYIMSPFSGKIDKFNNKMHWSTCSTRHMQNYLRSDAADCLKNKPEVIVPHFRKLPGKLYNRNQQCDEIFPSYVASSHYDCGILVCKKCWFFNVAGCKYKSLNLPPADGTSCGEGYMCLNGICVQDDDLDDF